MDMPGDWNRAQLREGVGIQEGTLPGRLPEGDGTQQELGRQEVTQLRQGSQPATKGPQADAHTLSKVPQNWSTG